jgi:hypothetical protein
MPIRLMWPVRATIAPDDGAARCVGPLGCSPCPCCFFRVGRFFAMRLLDIRLRRISMDLPVALGMAIHVWS